MALEVLAGTWSTAWPTHVTKTASGGIIFQGGTDTPQRRFDRIRVEVERPVIDRQNGLMYVTVSVNNAGTNSKDLRLFWRYFPSGGGTSILYEPIPIGTVFTNRVFTLTNNIDNPSLDQAWFLSVDEGDSFDFSSSNGASFMSYDHPANSGTANAPALISEQRDFPCIPILESLHVYLNSIEQRQDTDYVLKEKPDGSVRLVTLSAMQAAAGDDLEMLYVCGPAGYEIPGIAPLYNPAGDAPIIAVEPTPTDYSHPQTSGCTVLSAALLDPVNMPVTNNHGVILEDGPPIGVVSPSNQSGSPDYASFPTSGWNKTIEFRYWAWNPTTNCWTNFATKVDSGTGGTYGVTGRQRYSSNTWSTSTNWTNLAAQGGYLAYFALYVKSGATYLEKTAELGVRPKNA